MNDQYEVKKAMVAEIEAELDKLEAEAEANDWVIEAGYNKEYSTRQNYLAAQWKGLWKQKVALDMELYQIAFPDAKLEMNEEGTQFRSVS